MDLKTIEEKITSGRFRKEEVHALLGIVRKLMQDNKYLRLKIDSLKEEVIEIKHKYQFK